MLAIQKAMGRRPSPFREKLQAELFAMYNQLSNMEKGMWAQRARVSNIFHKDLNTKYFHMIVKVCQTKRANTMLKDANGRWVKDQ